MAFFLWCAVITLYFVPGVIAMQRKHPNVSAITALNVVAGWTFIGWVVALVWSLSAFAKPR